MTDFERLQEWVRNNFPVETYSDVDELIRDVRENFIKTGSYFPDAAEERIRSDWASVYNEREAVVYEDIRRHIEDEQLAADMLGSGHIPQAITDQIIQEWRQPEIMGVDISDLATTKEQGPPEDIQRYVERRRGFVNTIVSGFKRLAGFFRR